MVCAGQRRGWDHAEGEVLTSDATLRQFHGDELTKDWRDVDADELHPPLFGATWHAAGSIYAFGGSDSVWIDSLDQVAASEGIECWGGRAAHGITDELWRLDRQRTAEVGPVWTHLRGGDGSSLRADATPFEPNPDALPRARVAAASWTTNSGGMIFGGKFNFCRRDETAPKKPDESEVPASGYYMPPTAAHEFNGTGWRTVGGVDAWTAMSAAQFASAVADGFVQSGMPKWVITGHEAAAEWPLPRSRTQVWMIGDDAYMFSGVLNVVRADKAFDADASTSAESMLLNDFWRFNPYANYERDRTLYAQRIATCGTVINRPMDLAQGHSYPGPRQDAGTWSASTDRSVLRPELKNKHLVWESGAWLFGGVGKRRSAFGAGLPGAACVADELQIASGVSPDDPSAQVAHLCDLWLWVPRSGWRLIDACLRDRDRLATFGVHRDIPVPSSVGSGRYPQSILDKLDKVQLRDGYHGPAASIFATTWVEHEWFVDPAMGDDLWHAKTSLWIFGGVQDCHNAAAHQGLRRANDSACDVVWPRPDPALSSQDTAAAVCSSDLWRFDTLEFSWSRVAASGNGSWPGPRCGAIGPGPTLTHVMEDRSPTEGNGSVLLAGGWAGVADGRCEPAGGPDPHFSRSKEMRPAASQSRCYAAADLWRFYSGGGRFPS